MQGSFMNSEKIIKKVLEQYVGSQINIDSESARDLLAKHISSELDNEDYWAMIDDDAKYNVKVQELKDYPDRNGMSD